MSEFSTVLSEKRTFPPSPDFAAKAHLGSMEAYRKLCAEAEANPDAYWAARAKEELFWQTPFSTVCEWIPPHAKWFLGGKTNLSYNAIDRHLAKDGDKIAIRFEGEPGDRRDVTIANSTRRSAGWPTACARWA